MTLPGADTLIELLRELEAQARAARGEPSAEDVELALREISTED
jgi:hypothetical protein